MTSTPRAYSLSFLTAWRCSAPQAVRVAAEAGYQYVGLRPWRNGSAGPCQPLIGDPQALRETTAALRDTGVRVFDLEIVRIGDDFDPHTWDALYEVGAALGAQGVLVAADDRDPARLADHYARLCEAMAPFGLKAEVEFMPWTAVQDANAALALIERAGRPANAGILVDALHVGRSRTTAADLRALPRELLHYAQICDAEAGLHFSEEELIHTARCARLLPGQGSIDLRGLFDALPADLPVAVEVVNFEAEQDCDPRTWAARCLAASRPYCEPRT